MKRILMVLTVAALMAAMLVVSALPAFAAPATHEEECVTVGGLTGCGKTVTTNSKNENVNLTGTFSDPDTGTKGHFTAHQKTPKEK